MPTVFGDRLHVDGQVFTIDCHPLEPWLASLPRAADAVPAKRLYGELDRHR